MIRKLYCDGLPKKIHILFYTDSLEYPYFVTSVLGEMHN